MKSLKKLKIGVVSSAKGFCYYYRIKWPLEELEKQGLIEWERVNQHDGLEHVGELAYESDVIIFQFGVPSQNIIAFQKFIHDEKLPKIIVSEFDDNFLNIHPSNNAYRVYGTEEVTLNDGTYVWQDKKPQIGRGENEIFDIELNRERMALMCRAISVSDIVTVTQPTLAESYKKFNPNVFSLGNYINPPEMGKPQRKNDRIYIMWQGGDSHHHDIRMVFPALKELKKMYGDLIQFQFFGVSYFKMLEEIDAKIFPWVRPQNFYRLFGENMAHIGIIPLLDNVFNRCKSNIKWLEYSYYSVPSVVANLTPYKEHIDNGRTGLLYNDNNEFVKNVSRLIEDPILRINMGADAQKTVISEYTIQTHAQEWYDLYKNTLEQKIEYFKGV